MPGPSQHVLGDAVTESEENLKARSRDFKGMADEVALSDVERGTIARKLILQSPPGEVMQVANGESSPVKGFGVCWLRAAAAPPHTHAVDGPANVGEPQLTRWLC